MKTTKTKKAKKTNAEKFTSFTVKGKGDSLWCHSHTTKGVEFKVTKAVLHPGFEGEPYELELFGPKTEWYHYTDSGIQKQASKAVLPWLKAQYPEHKITGICWSEQGMQPDRGWSFDICVKE